MSILRALLLGSILCVGCAPCGIDFTTPGGIEVCVHGDPASRADLSTYIDACQAVLDAYHPRMPRTLVEVFPQEGGPRRLDGLAGRAVFRESPFGTRTAWYIQVRWYPGWGLYAYGHERIHQFGFQHGEDDPIWEDERLNLLQDQAETAGRSAVFGP